MALFRKFFYRKPPEGLLEISDRVYVFDCCFTANLIERNEYEVYIGRILNQLHEYFPDSSFMVFNFEDEENTGQITEVLSEYVTTVIDYPSQYENCPLLTLEMIHHFLKSSESWLCIGQRNVLLMHCENRALPILAFMLAALLIYMKQYTGEQRTLEMIYKQAPQQLLQLLLPLNPLPSQLRYLQYVSRRNIGSRWPPLDRALTLDCVILRVIPDMDGKGGCRPLVRIYGQDPLMAADRTTKVLFSMPKRNKTVGYVIQVVFRSCPLSTLLMFSSLLVHAPASSEENADCELVKIDVNCHVQGDVVLECITLDENLEHEEMMFRVMFNTAFIRSNILMLTRDEIDILWNAKDQFPKDFRAEVLFSEMDSSSSLVGPDLPGIQDKEGLPIEAFAKVQDIFDNLDWQDSETDIAFNMIQQMTASSILQETLEMSV
ncbi:UNVERIFIED_CONTAM: Formin-like protein 18 [Sesamum radiatum]|uniref:Formin-like protein 18 n=1 Tax=Sesamum radiatum TaxID=300843 RepID=A0AAW2MHB0_SESRA